MEIWEEPVRGGFPPVWAMGMPREQRQDRFLEVSLPPPIHHFVGTTPTEWAPGESTATMPASPWLASPQGRIPLGALTIIADLGFGMACNTLPLGGGFTTAELSLTRVREPLFGGDLVTHGRLIHIAGTMGLTEAKVYDRAGHLVAAGTSRLSIFPPPDTLPEVPDPLPTLEVPTYDTPDPWQRPVGDDGVLDAGAWANRSGREVLEAYARDELPVPPIGRLTGLRVVDVGDGTATVSMPASPWMATPARTVQGGFTALIADTALACAVQTVLERGDGFVPVDIKVNYLRPVFPDGSRLQAVAMVTHRGRSLAIAHATVTNAEGKPVAMATGSAALVPSLG